MASYRQRTLLIEEKRQQQAGFRRLLTALGCMVVFAIAVALMAPASAATRDTTLQAGTTPGSGLLGAGDGGTTEEVSEPYQLSLYGYNFGGLYKRYTAAQYAPIVIGQPDDVKDYLTVENEAALAQTPFTYASEGFNVEKIGLVQQEENTSAGYKYDVVGFVPVVGSEIAALTSADEYNSSYVFDSKEAAQGFVNSNKGVLYGQVPSSEMLASLHDKGSLAVVWQQGDPIGFRSTKISADPSSVPLGDGQEFSLRPGFSGVQKGNYSEHPLQVTLTLDEGLTYSQDFVPSIADTDTFAIDPESVKVSEDRKSLTFNITEIKKDYSSYSYLPLNVKVDVGDVSQTRDTITLSAVNGWGKDVSERSAAITIIRPTIRTMLDDEVDKTLYFGRQDQQVTLKVEHGNAVAGQTKTHVSLAFPNLVTVKSAQVSESCKNAISNFSVKTEEGISTIEYDVDNYVVSSGKATDVIDLVLDVKEKGDQNQETGSTVCVAVENNEQVLVTQNATVTLSEPYFEVMLYGPQDGWMDMSRGDGRAYSSNRTLKFYGADDYTALAMHGWSFDEDPIKGIYSTDADGSVMVGPVVNNLYTNMQWTLVGFVPISYWSGVIRDRWDPLYGVYYLEDLDACKQLIQDNNGVLYGETPTEEQAQSLAQYLDRYGRAKVVCVWYIQEPPKEVYQKYGYTESEEYVPKVHPAAYSATSNGIEVAIESGSVHSGSGVHPYNVTFTIPEDYDESTITLNTEFNNAMKAVVSGFQPGDKLEWNITVIDKSGKYGYLKDSGAVGTIDYYNAEGFNYSVIGQGFEGYQIENADEKPGGTSAKSRITRRGGNYAIRKLAEISEVNMVDNPTDARVGEALYAIGYGATGEGDDKQPLDKYKLPNGDPDYAAITQNLLDDYYLDYLNAVYYAQDAHKDEDKTNPHYKGFADLSAADYRSIFNSDTGTQVMETNPVLVDAMYYGMYEQSILMSESENGIENYQGTYSWMHDWNEATEGNKYEQVIYNQYEETATPRGDGAIVHNLHWYQWVTGTRNGNNMQDTYFGLAYQFKLVKRVKITKVQMDHKDSDHILTDAKFSLTKVEADGSISSTQPLGLPYETKVDDKGEILFPALLPGRYKLQEIEVPAGYVLKSDPWYLNISATGKATFEAPSTLVSNVTDQASKTRFNEFWVENEPGAELPNTGGPGTELFAIPGLLMIGLSGAFLLRRRKVGR